jgi:hypothetical protein
VDAEILDVDVTAQTGIEEQIPAGMMIVVVNEDPIAVPIPIATVIEVVRSHDPVGIVEQYDAAGARVETAGNEGPADVFVAAVGIGMARADSIVLGIPVGMRVVGIVPAAMFAIVVMVAVVGVLVPSFVLSIVMVVIAILRWSSGCEGGRQCHEKEY